MSFTKIQLILLLALNVVEGFKRGWNIQNCNDVAIKNGEISVLEFYSFINKTQNEITQTFNWIWRPKATNLNGGIWDVLYKEEKLSGTKSGRNVLFIDKDIILYINWIFSDGKLSWTTTHTEIPSDYWKINLCFRNTSLIFDGNSKKWTLSLGNISIDSTKGSSGSIKIGTDFLSSSSKIIQRQKRSPQNEDSADDSEKQTVWNRLKGYFRELFNRGPDDQRGWLTRMADWILGFLERLLT